MVVSFFFNFHPYLGKWSNLTSIFFKWVEATKQVSQGASILDDPSQCVPNTLSVGNLDSYVVDGWFRNPVFTSWYDGKCFIIYRVSYKTRWLFGISEPSTVSLLSFVRFLFWAGLHPGRLTWNIIPWRFGRSFSFLNGWFVGSSRSSSRVYFACLGWCHSFAERHVGEWPGAEIQRIQVG